MPAKKRAANPNPLKSEKTPSMEEQVTNFTKSNYNLEFEIFEAVVDKVRREVRKTVDYRKSVNDASPESIKHYTNETIKKILRASRWA